MKPSHQSPAPSPQLIDSHAHFENVKQAEAQLLEAQKHGVEQIIAIGADLESSQLALDIAGSIPDIKASVGIHPHDAQKGCDRFSEWEKLAKSHLATAIGECGLDYHYMNSPKEIQREVFKKQLLIAKELGLPVIVHSREAMVETLEILEKDFPPAGCVLHCYSGNEQQAKKALELGCYLAFGGVITFKNAKAAQIAKEILLERIVLETDSPYLSPEPFRGKKNTPANLPLIAEKLAELKEISFKEVCLQTTENTRKLFRLM